MDSEKTSLGISTRNNSFGSLFVCSHERGTMYALPPKIFTLSNEKDVYRVGRPGDPSFPVDITLDTYESQKSFTISRHQGMVQYDLMYEAWKYVPSGGKSYIRRQDRWYPLENNKAYVLNELDILGFGFDGNRYPNAEQHPDFQPCASAIFVPYRIAQTYSSIALDGRPIQIGRRADQNNVVINLPQISGKHARISFSGGRFYLHDLNSTNGTYNQNGRIRSRVGLQDIDIFSLCDIVFFKIGNTMFISNPYMMSHGEVIISARIANKIVKNDSDDPTAPKTKSLLTNVNVDIKKGTLVAAIGGSGAGKTTLMNCLNGMDQSFNGSVRIEGIDIHASKHDYKKKQYLIGNVPQSNVIHDYLTIDQELKQAARLRIGRNVSNAELEKMVTKVVNDYLGLEKERYKLISKLSGGQKRRVSIGVELVSERSIIFMDEPDAGLDPLTKKELFTLLSKLKTDGKTIIVIIHDIQSIELFDQLIIMGKKDDTGRLVFSGSPAEALSALRAKNFLEIYENIEHNISLYLP